MALQMGKSTKVCLIPRTGTARRVLVGRAAVLPFPFFLKSHNLKKKQQEKMMNSQSDETDITKINKAPVANEDEEGDAFDQGNQGGDGVSSLTNSLSQVSKMPVRVSQI
jgi:hypothetical protein